MPPRIDIPRTDRVGLPSLVLTALLSLAAGLALAYWGTGADTAVDRSGGGPGAGVRAPSAGGGGGPPDEGREGRSAADEDDVAPVPEEQAPGAPSVRPAVEAGAAPVPEEQAPGAPSVRPAVEAGAAPVAADEAPGGAVDQAEATTGEGARRPGRGAVDPRPTLRVVPGRVAYLRCDGVPLTGPGPSRCPRDEALEAEVWGIVRGLGACPDAPAGAGRADLRLVYRGSAQPRVLWRDTFAPGVVRLDRTAVLRCLAEPLAEVRPTVASTHLSVSFRFRVEP
ncbi:MAG: hypothetical protein ACFCGT_02440 [Sandaracinaceae bacterium]